MAVRGCCLLLWAALAGAALRCLPAQENPLLTPSAPAVLGPPALNQPTAAGDVAHNRSGDGIVAGRTRTGTTGGNSYQLWAQPLRRGEPSGGLVSVATALDASTGNQELTRVRCAIGDLGDWVVAWDATDPVSGWLQVFARRFHAATGQLGPVLRISPASPPASHEILPDVAMGTWPGQAGASFYVAWQDGVAAGTSRIMLRRYRLLVAGATVTDVPDAAVQVNSETTSPTGGQDRPAIAIDAAGTVTIAWERYDAWGPGSPYWRTMLRRRSGTTWLAVLDPQSPGAGPGGLDFTDYEASPPGDPAFPSDARFPPRVAVAADGRTAVAWRRGSGAPYGFRAFTPGPASAVSALPPFAWLPLASTAGHGSFDAALSNEGSLVFLWETLLTTTALSGRIIFSRLRFATGITVQEIVLDPTVNEGVTSVAVATSDTGLANGTWTRGPSLTAQHLHKARVDLNLVALHPTPGPTRLHCVAPGSGGFLYQVWPSTGGGDPGSYALLPLPDGRAADLSYFDPLLQWFLATGGTHPLLPDATGTLTAFGEADVHLVLPPGIGPIGVTWTFLVADLGQPFPASIRLFTQPEMIVIP